MLNYNIEFFQGSYFGMRVNLQLKDGNTVTPVDLTSYAVRGQIRRTYQNEAFVNFDIEVLDALNGLVRVSLPATVTADMKAGVFVYDIEVYDPLDTALVYKPLYGNVTVKAEVTR